MPAAVPSTVIEIVPVGTAVDVLELEATWMVMTSDVPEAGVSVAAVSVVVAWTSVVTLAEGQAVKRLNRSTDPSPVASSYPVPAE